jgi:hypothetical protein
MEHITFYLLCGFFISKDITGSKSNFSFLLLTVSYNAVAYLLEVFVCVCGGGGRKKLNGLRPSCLFAAFKSEIGNSINRGKIKIEIVC